MPHQNEAPAPGSAARGAGCLPDRTGTPRITQLSPARHRVTFEVIDPNGSVDVVQLTGRAAWLAEKLIEAGPLGLTAADLSAGLRVSGFVHRARRAGVPIAMTLEPNGGDWGGRHGRYRFTCQVRRLAEGQP